LSRGRISQVLTAGLVAFLSYAQESPAFRIAGRLVRHADGRPMQGAHVSIAPAERQDSRVSVSTGEGGAFSFSGLPPGKYSLRAEYRGSSQTFQQDEEFSTAIAVGPRLDSEHISFQWDSPASISGSVIDEEGEPVRFATVYLFAQTVARGTFRTTLAEQTQTSTTGTFHFGHLKPGAYYLAVTGRPWYAQDGSRRQSIVGSINGPPQGDHPPEPEPRSELDVAFPLTYYASAMTPEAATPLKLEEGTKAEIQLALHAVPAFHIALDSVEKQSEQQVQALLSQVGPGGALLQVQQSFGGNGIDGVAPGNYVLSANLVGQNQQSSLGSQIVSLTGDSTVHLNAAVKTSVSGKVLFDGDLPPNLGVWTRNVVNGNAALATVAHDGSFDLTQIQPGRYALLLGNTPDLYMEKITVKGGAFKNGEMEVPAGAQIELTISAGRGLTKVNGRAVKDTKGGGAMVLLIPQDLSHGRFIPRDQSDSDGTFTLFGVAPGRYTLVAIENGRGLAYADPPVMAPYLPGGRVIDVPVPKDDIVEVAVQPRR
jgi:protocatechuate 3,4-dioxygenase beta subunit